MLNNKKEMEKSLEDSRVMINYCYAITNGFRVNETLNRVCKMDADLGRAFRAAENLGSLRDFAEIYINMCESTENTVETLLGLDIFDEDSNKESIVDDTDIDEDIDANKFDIKQFIEISKINAKMFETLALNLRYVRKPEEWYPKEHALDTIKIIDEDLYQLVKVLIDKGFDEVIDILINNLETLSKNFEKIFEIYSLKDEDASY